MTLQSRINALSTSIAQEVKALRLAISAKPSADDVAAQIQGVVGAAPDALNTLQKLAAALEADQSAAAGLVAGLASANAAIAAISAAIGDPDTDFSATFLAALEA